jgi:hypothetical protein
MPELTKVARYTYHLFSSRDADDLVVYLYDEHADIVGQLAFVPNSQPLPPAKQIDGKHMFYFRCSRFPEVIDMLRNEGPIYLHWKDGSNSTLSTEYEPVGEGELA